MARQSCPREPLRVGVLCVSPPHVGRTVAAITVQLLTGMEAVAVQPSSLLIVSSTLPALAGMENPAGRLEISQLHEFFIY